MLGIQWRYNFSKYFARDCKFGEFFIFWDMIDKDKSRRHTVILARSIDLFFSAVDWTLFLGFSMLAAHFMINVIHQYQVKATSFSQSLEPIAKMPTIVMCIEGNIISKYGKEVKLDYYAEGRFFDKKQKLKENRTYTLTAVNETFRALQVQDKCIMLESNLTSIYKHGVRRIVLTFKKPMKQVHFYFTSKANAIGSVFRQWWDGRVLDIVIGTGSKAVVNIESTEKRYMNFNNRCSDINHLDKWAMTNLKEEFMNGKIRCPKKCSPTTFFLHALPLCGWEKQGNSNCATRRLRFQLRKFTADFGYVRPCNILEYQGYKTFEELIDDNQTVTLEYSFAPPFMTTVHQEYLIFDVTGMIGSVGGTLGMCIGFSFSGVTTTVLDLIKTRILKSL